MIVIIVTVNLILVCKIAFLIVTTKRVDSLVLFAPVLQLLGIFETLQK